MPTRREINKMREELCVMRRELACYICKKIISDPLTSKCGHSFCAKCTKLNWIKKENCPRCVLFPIDYYATSKNPEIEKKIASLEKLTKAFEEDTKIDISKDMFERSFEVDREVREHYERGENDSADDSFGHSERSEDGSKNDQNFNENFEASENLELDDTEESSFGSEKTTKVDENFEASENFELDDIEESSFGLEKTTNVDKNFEASGNFELDDIEESGFGLEKTTNVDENFEASENLELDDPEESSFGSEKTTKAFDQQSKRLVRVEKMRNFPISDSEKTTEILENKKK